MNTQYIGRAILGIGMSEVHYLCCLTKEEWDKVDGSAEAAEFVRESIEARHQWEVKGFRSDLDVSIVEHPALIRGFIAIARLTQQEASAAH